MSAVTSVLETVLCLYKFAAQNAEELSFEKGEKLDVIEHPSHDPEWWRAVNARGDSGLVPTNYIQVSFLLLALLWYTFCNWINEHITRCSKFTMNLARPRPPLRRPRRRRSIICSRL